MSATTERPVARLRMNAPESGVVAIPGIEWSAFWQQLRQRLLADGYRPNTLRVYALRLLMAGDNIRAVQESLGHHSIKTTLRYQACIPPKAASPADPEPPELALKRLAQVLDRLSTLAATVPQTTFAQGP